jgi:CHAD domain-containing protein
MPEAGRKILLGEFIKMLKVEDGSRTGEDIEDVHKMRVAIRRLRSAFRLLRPYYKTKVVEEFNDELRKLMTHLGKVRDLDVLIHDLTQFMPSLNDEGRAIMQTVIDTLDQRRVAARAELNHTLDSKNYRRFQKTFTRFLTTEGAGARSQTESLVTPYQVRHVLTLLIYKHLAAVRAYETVLDNADAPTLHMLRIEFKRLRYTLSLFSDVLTGKEIEEFSKELVTLQDLLGRINDISVAQERLHGIMDDLEGDQRAVLQVYLDSITSERPQLESRLPDIWRRFNSKPVQRKLANAVAGL